ncbi:MAG: hypothetical protein IIB15_05320 [Chloroflexi bacterium]|nr:hypothetical protein [Chloroflexota bacterium]
MARCKGNIDAQIRSIEEGSSNIESPILLAVAVQSLFQNNNPLAASVNKILRILEELEFDISGMDRQLRSIDSSINSLESDVSDIEENTSQLETVVSRIETDIARIENDLTRGP